MATWIAHLRIAEQILKKIPEFEPASFVSGSVAPDCGLPNDDWSEFTPPKQITHYHHKDGELQDLRFFREYLAGHTFKRRSETDEFFMGLFSAPDHR